MKQILTNKHLLYIGICLFVVFPIYSQKPKIIKTSGEAQIEFPEYKSERQVKHEVLQLATINALERAFGRTVIIGNATYLKNIITGELVETNTAFYMYANTMVKGDVLKTIDEAYEIIEYTAKSEGKEKTFKEMKCWVEIEAIELTENHIECEVYTLNGLDKKYKCTTFKAEEDNLFVYFKAPVNGYLAVFLDDGKHTQCLLPYKNMDSNLDSGIPIERYKEYIFFSNNENLDYFETPASKYLLYTSSPQEQNRLFIVFSRTPLIQPDFTDQPDSRVLSSLNEKNNWILPNDLTSEEFLKWLINCRIKNKDIGVEIVDIIIRK